jgi:hypothetical protein
VLSSYRTSLFYFIFLLLPPPPRPPPRAAAHPRRPPNTTHTQKRKNAHTTPYVPSFSLPSFLSSFLILSHLPSCSTPYFRLFPTPLSLTLGPVVEHQCSIFNPAPGSPSIIDLLYFVFFAPHLLPFHLCVSPQRTLKHFFYRINTAACHLPVHPSVLMAAVPFICLK